MKKTHKHDSTPSVSHLAITPSGLSMQPPTHVSTEAGTAGGNLRAGSTVGTASGVTSTAATANLGTNSTGNAGDASINPMAGSGGGERLAAGDIAGGNTDTGDLAATGPGGKKRLHSKK